jgi:hypothetical protein
VPGRFIQMEGAMPGTATKRQKEQLRQQHRVEKKTRREQRKNEKAERPKRLSGEEDPDIAGIIPGPQPIPEFGP